MECKVKGSGGLEEVGWGGKGPDWTVGLSKKKKKKKLKIKNALVSYLKILSLQSSIICIILTLKGWDTHVYMQCGGCMSLSGRVDIKMPVILQEHALQSPEHRTPWVGKSLHIRSGSPCHIQPHHPARHSANVVCICYGSAGTTGEQEVPWHRFCIHRKCHGATVSAAGSFSLVCLSHRHTRSGLVLWSKHHQVQCTLISYSYFYLSLYFYLSFLYI